MAFFLLDKLWSEGCRAGLVDNATFFLLIDCSILAPLKEGVLHERFQVVPRGMDVNLSCCFCLAFSR